LNMMRRVAWSDTTAMKMLPLTPNNGNEVKLKEFHAAENREVF
jgi:hypothetical protein